MLPLSLARQTWPRRGSPQAWQRFLDSTPDSRSLRPFSMRCQRLRMDGTVLQGRRNTTRPHLGPSRLTTARMIWSSSGDQQLPRHVTGAATSPMKAERRANICFEEFKLRSFPSLGHISLSVLPRPKATEAPEKKGVNGNCILTTVYRMVYHPRSACL